MAKKKNKFFRVIRNVFIALFFSSVFFVVVYRFVPVCYTPLMFIRVAEQISDGKPVILERSWVSIDNISPNMIRAVIAAEDNRFLKHNGFDFRGIKKAYEGNRRGKRIRGGSTITQQTAKNVFLVPNRSYVRKALEAYFTLLIEIFWSKERIMEVYLNVIEVGNGIYGVEKASEVYFHKSPKYLTESQAASIAACLPNPRKYKVVNSGPYMQRRKARILRLMPKMGRIDFDK